MSQKWIVLPATLFLWVFLTPSAKVFALDTTAPTTPVVTDDGAYTSSVNQLHASWSSSEPESKIAEYQYQIRENSPSGTIIVNWTSTGTATSVTKTGLSLLHGKRYFFGVKARNTAKLWSLVGYSDGILVDTTNPNSVAVSDDGDYTVSTTQLHAVWTTSSDPESGIVNYYYDIEEVWPDGSFCFCASGSTGLATEVTRSYNLKVGNTYYIGVRAINGAGLASYTSWSNGITVTTDPSKIRIDITANTTWTLANSPYTITYPTTVTNNATLTIEPGVEIRFGPGSSLTIGNLGNGTLMAKGAPTQPILFTGTTKSPGAWNGVHFSSLSKNSNLDYCIIEYAGGGAPPANIHVKASNPTITHTTVRSSSVDGIYVENAAAPLLAQNSILGNGRYGLNGVTDVIASVNWWGSASGPSGIGPGTGEAVSGKVVFEPWLSQPPVGSFEWVAGSQSPDPISQQGGKTTFSGILSEAGSWTLTIKDAGGSVARTFSGAGTSFTQNWTGDGPSGNPLPNGTYTYQMDAISQATGESAVFTIGRVTLDNNLPIAEITNPSPNQMLASGTSLNVLGTAGGSNFSSYKLEYGVGTLPGSWSMIASKTTPVVNGLLSSWNLSGLTQPVYTLRLTVTTTSGATVNQSVVVRILNLSAVSDSPDPFSPNGDGAFDNTTLNTTATYLVDWALRIKNSLGVVVRTLTGTGQGIAQAWDGKDTNGTTVSDGLYNYQFEGTNPETGVTLLSGVGQVTVDTTPPTAIITNPAEGQTFLTDDPISFTGTADDANFYYYTLSYGVGTSPTTFTYLFSSVSRTINGRLYTLDVQTLQPGTYTFRLTAQDKAGSISTFDRRITLDHISITGVSATPTFIDPYNREKSTISYTVNRKADVTIQIYGHLSRQLVQTFIQAVSRAATKSVTWDGTNSTGGIAPLETYFFTISATDANGRRGSWNNATFPVLGTAPYISSYSLDATNFDPYRNDLAKLNYNLNAPGKVTAEIWGNLSPTTSGLVRTLLSQETRSAGYHTELWEGRNNDGRMYQGTYNIYTTAGSSLPLKPIVLARAPIEFSNFRAEAYLIQPVFGEVSLLTYTLTRDATVSIQLSDPNGNAVRTLVTAASQAAGAQQKIEWNGRTDDGKLVAIEGDYTVTLTAVDPVTGLSYIRRGTVMVYK